MPDLSVVTMSDRRAREIRRTVGKALRAHFEDSGDNLAGFVVVTWDMRGEVTTSVLADDGPIGRSMVPMFAHDALNRHIARG